MRKVRAGWYTETVVDFEERYETGAPEFHVDVHSDEKGWIVSYRRDVALKGDDYSKHIAYFDNFAGAKDFALAVALAYRNEGNLPRANSFDKGGFSAWEFDWGHVLAGKRGK
jgi:hypothetical protein